MVTFGGDCVSAMTMTFGVSIASVVCLSTAAFWLSGGDRDRDSFHTWPMVGGQWPVASLIRGYFSFDSGEGV